MSFNNPRIPWRELNRTLSWTRHGDLELTESGESTGPTGLAGFDGPAGTADGSDAPDPSVIRSISSPATPLFLAEATCSPQA